MPRMILAPARPDLQGVVPTGRRGFIARMLGLATGGFLLGRANRAMAAPGSVMAADPFLGEIAMVAFNFAPAGWALCNGQLMPISGNTALFSLLGTYYGGNGQSTFGLPDLRGRFPLHQTGAYPIGTTGGAETHTLSVSEMPAHNHTAIADTGLGTSADPAGRLPARNPAGIPAYGSTAGAAMNAGMVSPAGGSIPHNNMPPYQSVNFIIALQGVFPPQS